MCACVRLYVRALPITQPPNHKELATDRSTRAQDFKNRKPLRRSSNYGKEVMSALLICNIPGKFLTFFQGELLQASCHTFVIQHEAKDCLPLKTPSCGIRKQTRRQSERRSAHRAKASSSGSGGCGPHFLFA